MPQKKVKHEDGIAPSRHGGEESIAGAHESVPPDGFQEGLLDGRPDARAAGR